MNIRQWRSKQDSNKDHQA